MFSRDHSRHIMRIVESVILATGGQILYIGLVSSQQGVFNGCIRNTGITSFVMYSNEVYISASATF
jgi:hypothetical protein